MLVFFIGSITELPALRSFAIWAGIGIFFDFVFSVTFFAAFLYYDEVRIAKGRIDLLRYVCSLIFFISQILDSQIFTLKFLLTIFYYQFFIINFLLSIFKFLLSNFYSTKVCIFVF